MKKTLLVILLVLAMCLSCLVACEEDKGKSRRCSDKETKPEAESNSGFTEDDSDDEDEIIKNKWKLW